MFFFIAGLRKSNSPTNEATKSIGLRQGLTVELVYPLRRTVSRNHNQWDMLIIGFGHSGHQVQQC